MTDYLFCVFILVCGVILGETQIASDLLRAVRGHISRPRRVRPVATLPPAWVEHLGHLNRPTVTRRRRIEVIDV